MAGCLHPASITLNLSVLHCVLRSYCMRRVPVPRLCVLWQTGLELFSCVSSTCAILSACVPLASFLISPSAKGAWKRLSRRERKKKKKGSQTCLHNSPVIEETYVLFWLGRWRPSCLLKKREDLTDNPTSIEYRWMSGKRNNLNRSLAFSLHPRSSTDPALWLPGLTVLQRPSLELESAIIITGLFANSAVPNGSKLALYCSHSMDLA